MRERFIGQGGFMPLGTPESFGTHIAAETKKFGDVIQKANIKVQ